MSAYTIPGYCYRTNGKQ